MRSRKLIAGATVLGASPSATGELVPGVCFGRTAGLPGAYRYR